MKLRLISMLVLSLMTTPIWSMGFVNVTKKMLLQTARESASVPLWLVIAVGALVVLFTVLLIISPVGSNRRRGKKRTIF